MANVTDSGNGGPDDLDQWRVIPQAVLDAEKNQADAENWEQKQRQQIADTWAAAQKAASPSAPLVSSAPVIDPGAASDFSQPSAGPSATPADAGVSAVPQPYYPTPAATPAPPRPQAPPAVTDSSSTAPTWAPSATSRQTQGWVPPTTAGMSGGVPKTVSQTGGTFYGLDDRGMGVARQAGDLARQAGYGDEGARALQAILLTEGGLTGARGDQGSSAGPLQFYGRGGMLNTFAQQNSMSLSDAANYVEQNPLDAIRWALGDQDKPGYLGAALKYGISKGLTGSDLATFAQANGQRSVSPERAGQWFNTLFSGGQDPFSSPITAGAAGAINLNATPADQRVATGQGAAADREDRARASYLNQFQMGLPANEAYAACGVAASIAFAKANGRNPTIQEAMQLARQVGWTPDQGMAGVASEQALLNQMGVASKLERDVDWNHVAQDAGSGNPVVVSTTGHYFYVDDVKQDQSGTYYHVGGSGTALRQGSEWMTADDMQRLMGRATGALYSDHPLAGGPSLTESQPPVSRPGVSYDRKEALPVTTQNGLGGVFAGVRQKAGDLQSAVQDLGSRVQSPQTGNPVLDVLGTGASALGTGVSTALAPFGGPSEQYPTGGPLAGPLTGVYREMTGTQQLAREFEDRTGVSYQDYEDRASQFSRDLADGKVSRDDIPPDLLRLQNVWNDLAGGTGSQQALGAYGRAPAAEQTTTELTGAGVQGLAGAGITAAGGGGPLITRVLASVIDPQGTGQGQALHVGGQAIRAAGESVMDATARLWPTAQKALEATPEFQAAAPVEQAALRQQAQKAVQDLLVQAQPEGATGVVPRTPVAADTADRLPASARSIPDEMATSGPVGPQAVPQAPGPAPAPSVAAAETLRAAQAEVDALTARYPQMTPGSLAASGAGKRLAAAKAAMEQAAPDAAATAAGAAPDTARLMDESVQLTRRLDAGTEDSGPLLNRLEEIDKQITGAEKSTPPAVVTQPTTATAAAPVADASLPKPLAGAKPRYGYGANQFQLDFESDVDKALYIIAQKTPSRADAQYMDFLHNALPGYADDELRGMGTQVRAQIKSVARSADPDEPLTVSRSGLWDQAPPTGQAPLPQAARAIPDESLASGAQTAPAPRAAPITDLASPEAQAAWQDRLATLRKDPQFQAARGSAKLKMAADAMGQFQDDVAAGRVTSPPPPGAQLGQVNPMFAVRVAGATAGGVAGYNTTPEDASPQERALRTLVGAGAGAAGVEIGAQAIGRFQQADAAYRAAQAVAGPGLGPNAGLVDWLRTGRTSALVSGLPTLTHVALNSVVQPVWKLGRDLPAGLVRLAAGDPQIAGEAMGTWHGLSAAADAAVQVLLHGQTADELLAGQVPRDLRFAQNVASNPVSQGAASVLGAFPTAHGTMQSATQAMVSTMELGRLAGRQAGQEGLRVTGPAFWNRVDQLMRTPLPGMGEAADAAGARAALRGDYGNVGQALNAIRNVPVVGEGIMPILRIAYNTGAQRIERSPLGLVGMAGQVGRDLSQGQGLRAALTNPAGGSGAPMGERLGNGLLGSALFAWGVKQALDGNITGPGPSDPKQLQALKEQGWQPFSVRVGGRYYSLDQSGTLGGALSQAATVADAWQFGKGDQTDSDRGQHAGEEYGLRFLQEGPTRSFVDAYNTLNELSQGKGAGAGERAGSWAVRQAIPQEAFLRNVGELQDPYERSPQGVGQQLQMSNPTSLLGGGRQSVPVKTDILGQPVPNPRQGFGIFQPYTSPDVSPYVSAYGEAGKDLAPVPKSVPYGKTSSIPLSMNDQDLWKNTRGDFIIQHVNAAGGAQNLTDVDLKAIANNGARAADAAVLNNLSQDEIDRRAAFSASQKATEPQTVGGAQRQFQFPVRPPSTSSAPPRVQVSPRR